MESAHQKQREFLKSKFEANQLAHAYVFTGPEGVGKKEFAKEFIKCINSNIAMSPAAIEKESFPDLLVIKSSNSKSSLDNEKDMMEIDVAQVREINHFLSYKSYYGNYKTVIIENAERMNTEAQHSFLKTLEEPKGKTLIFLISSKPELLLPTIFSRCQTISFFPTEKYQSSVMQSSVLKELLPIINGELAIKFQYAKKMNTDGGNVEKILQVLERHFRDMLFSKIGIPARIATSASNASHSDADWHSVAGGGNQNFQQDYSIEKLKTIIRLIGSLHAQLSTTNVNPKMAMEVLLLEL